MDFSLLATKLRIPPQLHRAVHRTQLTNVIEGGIPQYKLIHITAPAGYGKTTLLTQWAHSSNYQIAWLSVNEEDNDLERLLRCLVRAWEVVQPDIQESELGLRLGAMSPDSEAVLAAFINVADVIPTHTVFVLDDYHLIDDQSTHDALTFLLDHLPPTLHFVLAGRGEPPLALSRYRARNEMLELHTEDLRFSSDNAADFLNHQMGLSLTQVEIASLNNQMEGWVAGLQLAALSLQRHLTAVDRLVVSGQHRFIADYLNEDVLAPLEPDTRLFLLQTSILDRLCASLCEEVTGRENSQTMLEKLEREGLFLMPLDDHRQWFRYHQLFADFLRDQLYHRHTCQVSELHGRAAGWYLAHDLPESAFHHAVDGDDADLAVQVINRYLNAKVVGGEIKIVKDWVDQLPGRWLITHPILGLVRASFLVATGEFEASIHCLDEIEHNLRQVEDNVNRRQLARVTAVRCYIACFQNNLPQAETYADEVLRELPEEDAGGFRGSTYVALGDTYRRNGHWEAAKQAYLKVLDVSYSAPFRFGAAHVYGALADLELRQGRLRSAAGYWRKALISMQDRLTWGRLPLPVTGWVHIRMGELLYEWNELDEAWEHVAQGLERAELGGDVRALIAGYLIAGRMKLTEGNQGAAVDYLERARPLVESSQFAHWTSRFERFQLELWLAEDRLRAAVEWSDRMLNDTQLEERPESEVAQLAMAWVLIVQGDAQSIERALSLISRLLQQAETEGRKGVTIEALTLQALAQWRRGGWTDALVSLEQALRLAEPEGYIRLFVDFGLSMGRLLQEASSRNLMVDCVNRLLATFESEPTEIALPESLTKREQEVLELVAAGLTNAEIAEKLVISPETVKKHTGSIYSKLNVSNRTEAATRARELDMLN
ncbi:MAG: LuxR C-terminal-related transcriptional regulator [Anaerolineae bacterium]|nr:LuxR C-terminal-related transcriptional regulator [Anaerolineae bacterium]